MRRTTRAFVRLDRRQQSGRERADRAGLLVGFTKPLSARLIGHVRGDAGSYTRDNCFADTHRVGDVRAGLKPAPTDGDAVEDAGVRHGLPEIVRALKTYSAPRINATRGTPGASVWQRGYYERIVRNERELDLTRKYITSNPRNWRTDREHNKTHR